LGESTYIKIIHARIFKATNMILSSTLPRETQAEEMPTSDSPSKRPQQLTSDKQTLISSLKCSSIYNSYATRLKY
jgi:hypothetical protein